MTSQPAAGAPRFALVNDEPVGSPDADELGVGAAARQLTALLTASRTATPLTLAVDAGWGMGKSSLMRLVQADLDATPGVRTVWYNAWSATAADPLEGLIKSVLSELGAGPLRRSLRRLPGRPWLGSLLRGVLTAAASLVGAGNAVDAFWTGYAADARTRQSMRAEIRRMLGPWAEQSRMLVVFVDDLDRCAEDTVLAVCEAVKLYLDAPGIAFVIGCDQAALGRGGLLRDVSPAGAAFMEKIFQTSYRVPAPGTDGITRYVRACARQARIDGLLGAEEIGLIAERSGRNPRRVKRLINGVVLESTLNPVWQGFGPGVVIRMLLMQHLYPEFYRMMTAAYWAPADDAVTEFRIYQDVRRTLRSVPEPRTEDLDRFDVFFRQYEVPLVREALPESLAELERQLPTAFPELAADFAFASLLEELMATRDAQRLLERLREGVPLAQGADESGGAFAGMEILWVDDHPENNTTVVTWLQRGGATVYLAEDGDAAEAYLRRRPVALLISDIERHGNGQAGFTDLARWRSSGLYDGPAVFYTNRITWSRQERAQELGAGAVTGSGGLGAYVEGVAAGLSPAELAVPPAREAPASAARRG